MNIDRKVVEQALEALKANDLLVNGDDKSGGLVFCMDGYYSGSFDIESVNKQTDEAITAIRLALANEALDRMAENARELGLDYDAPVVTSDTSQERVDETAKQRQETPKREWVGLTDEQLHKIIRSGEYDSMEEFARAIEAKLKEKNHG
jgi:hypothetical protein